MKEDKIDKMLEYTFKVNSDNIKCIGDIHVPDFDKVMDRFEKNLEEKNTEKNQTSKKFNIKRNVAIAASFLVLLFVSTILSEVSEVRAFKFNMMKLFEEVKDNDRTLKFSSKSDEEKPMDLSGNGDTIEKSATFKEAQKKAKFNILKPEYLPEGYKLKEVKVIDKPFNRQQVKQVYMKEDKQIFIDQTPYNESKKTTLVTNEKNKCEKITINNQDITLIYDDDGFSESIWFSKIFEFNITIFDSVSKENFIKMIESLK
ncbi:DUF4367 domain-containing protein [Clostridium aestuarii]|uniref:DUF4367 domain-containing protein n=1 Tax=Clostridium aestuarii TaxID=338193 RepID=A0ABT4D2D5_9CLOT|nr:DUF4367 domain-containing protein [Clostridium aestuarii]MCY6485394.1 DUF4367 domain-containing protein [Clostridium aestuarii]